MASLTKQSIGINSQLNVHSALVTKGSTSYIINNNNVIRLYSVQSKSLELEKENITASSSTPYDKLLLPSVTIEGSNGYYTLKSNDKNNLTKTARLIKSKLDKCNFVKTNFDGFDGDKEECHFSVEVV